MLSLDSLTRELGIPFWLLIIVFIWSAIWKGLALWKSAKKGHMFWFILIFLTNTIGILEILYLFLFSELNLQKSEKKSKNANKVQKTSTGKNSKKS